MHNIELVLFLIVGCFTGWFLGGIIWGLVFIMIRDRNYLLAALYSLFFPIPHFTVFYIYSHLNGNLSIDGKIFFAVFLVSVMSLISGYIIYREEV